MPLEPPKDRPAEGALKDLLPTEGEPNVLPPEEALKDLLLVGAL